MLIYFEYNMVFVLLYTLEIVKIVTTFPSTQMNTLKNKKFLFIKIGGL